jgi:hypothetical protein
MTKKVYRHLAYLCFTGAIGAFIMAVLSWWNDFIIAYLINCVIFLICGYLMHVNFRKAGATP